MVKDNNLNEWLNQMLNLGESFTFEEGKIVENKEHFEPWINKAKEFLLVNKYLSEDKVTKKFYHNDESYYSLLSGYLTKIYLRNSNIL